MSPNTPAWAPAPPSAGRRSARLSGDLPGDRREGAVRRTAVDRTLRVATPCPPHPRTTTLRNLPYRTASAGRNTACDQPPHPGSGIGDGTARAPRPPAVRER